MTMNLRSELRFAHSRDADSTSYKEANISCLSVLSVHMEFRKMLMTTTWSGLYRAVPTHAV